MAAMLVAGAASPLFSRDRRVLAVAAATVASMLLWSAAPFTGVAEPEAFDLLLLSVLRYLLPAVAAGTLALALAAARPGAGVVVAHVGLAGALGWNVARPADLGMPVRPAARWILFAVAGGALGAYALGGVRPALGGLRSRARGWLAGLALVPVAAGYLRRHADTHLTLGTGVAEWLSDQREFRDGAQPILSAPVLLGPLAGDRLRRRQTLLESHHSCRTVRERAQDGWVVIMTLFEDLPDYRDVKR